MKHLLTPRQRAQLWIRLGIRALAVLGMVLILVWLVPPLWGLFMPFVFALIVAWFLHPPVRWLQNKLGISRKLLSIVLILLVYLAIGAALYALGHAALSQVRALAENWPEIRTSALALLETVRAYLAGFVERLPGAAALNLEELSARLMELLQRLLPSALDITVGGGVDLVSRIPSFAVAFTVFLMASYFITADYPRLRFLVTNRLPEAVQKFGSDFRRIFIEAFGGYLKSQLLLSLGVFVILAVGFFLMGQPYGLLLALLLAVLDFIPIVGAGTVMVPWAVISMFTADYSAAIWLGVIWGVIVLFRQFAEPKILGSQTGLSPILSLVGIYLGMRLGGVLGMIVGPLLLLVAVNLWKLGTFDPALRDIKLAFEDALVLLSGEDDAP